MSNDAGLIQVGRGPARGAQDIREKRGRGG